MLEQVEQESAALWRARCKQLDSELATLRARVAELEAAAQPPEWTSEPPKVAGRRWYRRKNGHEEIVRITPFDLSIIDEPWAGWHGSEWAGPIPEPSEPA